MKKKDKKENIGRRDFLKNAGMIGGAAALAPIAAGLTQEQKRMVKKVVSEKSSMTKDKELIDEAVGKVFVNAFQGERAKNKVSLVRAYNSVGGKSEDTIKVLTLMDSKLQKQKVFQKGFDESKMMRILQDGVVDFAKVNPGPAADKSSVVMEVKDTSRMSAKTFVEFGGEELQNVLTKQGVKR